MTENTTPAKRTLDDVGPDDRLSPFELKDLLIRAASSDAHRLMLNAGRGNPNFLATVPRRAFLRIGEFAVEESERSYSYLDSGFGGQPRLDGLVDRFDTFVSRYPDDPGVRFLRSALSFADDQLGLDEHAFLAELVEASLGSNYPTPPRILEHCEQIVERYLRQEMGDASLSFSLFATEGGTAAMTYLFQSLFANELLHPGDKIAIGTPIFSPYLEIPVLPGYDLGVVDIRLDQDADWQYPDAELDKLLDPAVKVFCLVNPSNPPSTKLSDERLHAIAELIRTKRPDLVVITDDVYGTFADDFTSLFAVAPANTILVYSFSKFFGATGWRLGVIGVHEENVVDAAIRALPADVTDRLAKRYSSLTDDVAGLRFIDRLVADSRAVALNHTAGLSLPQQLQMTLFAVHGLVDRRGHYKEAAKSLIRQREQTLYANVGAPYRFEPEDVDYYTLVDLQRLAAELHGAGFANWFAAGAHGRDYLFRLARETGVVLLPGKGFEVVDASARVSLANLAEWEYVAIGRFTRKVLDEYYAQYSAENGTPKE
ncbi:bifunctional aspartate transaminase/aspartate 4-decarboxylase [Pseudoclavibacter chungangensis]|uniref:Aminotransferase n=1 Tax=Pseudoclavibacter chungangensis TaxID=587635 RepID=A0A7J5BP35_9MICO|nr:bifunctional aspartate transaminase/aspartate 4-decarboxylase [Pseudoclavibacter chungangensis]KAB1654536.1 bifunctional aspartate transaminase/aspartate 4-decarboxylase [Pseudoclavibacter chungangensis]NYJ68237.1 aspartate 4-decarboxylase [Pseudoclavibacter chungangensis]